MTDKTARIHVEAAYGIARRMAYDQFKAQRKAELNDKIYKKFDSQGFHAVSVEVGRMLALGELLGTDVDPTRLRADAREDAQAEWREEVFADFLPAVDAEAA
jgi:hypothetical protein